MSCPESLHTQSYFDGELDGAAAREAERHLEGCASCRALLEDLEQTRGEVRRAFGFGAPEDLRAEVQRRIDDSQKTERSVLPLRARPTRSRPFWAGAFSGLGTGLAAATLIAILVLPSRNDVLVENLVSQHAGSLLPNHLIAVESSNHHTVKPWFAGRADVSPTVDDFASQGFTLIGGRTDYIDRQRAAVVVYRHNDHVLNVFSWRRSGASPADTTRDGYRMTFWTAGDLQYCAVSDASWETLHRLRELLRTASGEELNGAE
jgi:anti-sigma factor RsiW